METNISTTNESTTGTSNTSTLPADVLPKSMQEIKNKIKSLNIDEDFDIIVAIANGGIIPAALLNQKLNKRIELLYINRRDENNNVVYETPKLLSSLNFEVKNKRILLVDDRNKTGTTLNYAKSLLKGAKVVKTFVVNGQADYNLYDEACFKFPWK